MAGVGYVAVEEFLGVAGAVGDDASAADGGASVIASRAVVVGDGEGRRVAVGAAGEAGDEGGAGGSFTDGLVGDDGEVAPGAEGAVVVFSEGCFGAAVGKD